MTLITEIAHDDQQRQHDEIIIQQAQFFYDSAKLAEQRGEPVKALIHGISRTRFSRSQNFSTMKSVLKYYC